MLTVTPAASAAVAAVLDSPQVPDGCSLRLQQGVDASGATSIGIAIVSEPDSADAHVPVDAGRELLLSAEVAELLDDQTLDAAVEDENVSFTLIPQAADGGPPPG